MASLEMHGTEAARLCYF